MVGQSQQHGARTKFSAVVGSWNQTAEQAVKDGDQPSSGSNLKPTRFSATTDGFSWRPNFLDWSKHWKDWPKSWPKWSKGPIWHQHHASEQKWRNASSHLLHRCPAKLSYSRNRKRGFRKQHNLGSKPKYSTSKNKKPSKQISSHLDWELKVPKVYGSNLG